MSRPTVSIHSISTNSFLFQTSLPTKTNKPGSVWTNSKPARTIQPCSPIHNTFIKYIKHIKHIKYLIEHTGISTQARLRTRNPSLLRSARVFTPRFAPRITPLWIEWTIFFFILRWRNHNGAPLAHYCHHWNPALLCFRTDDFSCNLTKTLEQHGASSTKPYIENRKESTETSKTEEPRS